MDIEEEGGQRTLGGQRWKKEMWTTSFEYSWKKWRRKHETELDGQEWSVAYVPLGGDKV